MTPLHSAGPILVTGAFGNVGRFTVRALVEAGNDVVATDLRSRTTEAAAAQLAGLDHVTVRWLDLRNGEEIHELIDELAPSAVVHLAAVIPPAAYAVPELARIVNVDATGHLVDAISALPAPSRFIFASSIAVYGSRNPHTMGLLTADTPLRPRDVYGAHKAAAEGLVIGSNLDWTILRLGGVLFPDTEPGFDVNAVYLEALLPEDGRINCVDVRDVATACVAALNQPCSRQTLLIGGDETHRVTQGALSRSLTRALGLPGAIPPGRPGDPSDDRSWFVVDWMDTGHSQRLLAFQDHSFDQTMRDVAAHQGWKRHLRMPIAPLARVLLTWMSPHRGRHAQFTELWPGVARRWGDAALQPESGQ